MIDDSAGLSMYILLYIRLYVSIFVTVYAFRQSIYIIWLLIFVVVIIALSVFFLPDLFAPSGSSSSSSRYLSTLNLLFYIYI